LGLTPYGMDQRGTEWFGSSAVAKRVPVITVELSRLGEAEGPEGSA